MSRFIDALAQAADSPAGMTTTPTREPRRQSWAQVHEQARRGASVLADRGVEPGSAVAILAGSPIDVAPAAQSVWWAGGSVTMLHQPTARTDLTRYAADTAAVLAMLGAQAVIIGEPFVDFADSVRAAGYTAITVPELAEGNSTAPRPDTPEDATALLQLTSGSTAAPKAVRITHANLWANMTSMISAADIEAQRDVMVSWLPLFHDMGMVGFLTLPMCHGLELVKATPADFLASPISWMQLISDFGGTITAAPNFAYALAARVLPRAESLDLSTLRFALNGAEPVDVAAVRSFLGAGERFGLASTAVVPAYGMAEATLGVSFHPWGTPLAVDEVLADDLEEHQRAVPVSVAAPADGHLPADDAPVPVRVLPLLGPPLDGIEVEARRSDGGRCSPREVGPLFIRGDAVTAQYVTVDGPQETLDAHGWLDTGDLGYRTETGAVVVCGRVKDIIIMGGRNIYPTDIERAAQSVPGVRAGNTAAVRIDAGQRRETFGVIVESRQAGDDEARQRLADEVRAAVTRDIGARPAAVRVVPAGTLPKTPSGKIKRGSAQRLLTVSQQREAS